MAQYRKNRLSHDMKKEISEIIQNDMKDPRLGFISIMAVDVAGDLAVAKVYVSHLGSEENLKESMEALKSGAGFIRRQLSKRFQTRTVPELIFIADDSIEHGMKISKILDEYKAEIPDNPPENEAEGDKLE